MGNDRQCGMTDKQWEMTDNVEWQTMLNDSQSGRTDSGKS